MRFYIMRHGDAISHARTDAERPLSDKGRAQVAQMAEHFQAERPARVVASPYLRAQQTARLLCDALGIGHFDTVEDITPDSDPFAALAALEPHAVDGLLMVSHQPLVGSLLGLLVEGAMTEGGVMGTASVAALQLPQLGVGLAQMQWLRHPR